MSILEPLKKAVGLGTGDRSATPPHYRTIAPGLVVTDTDAWAWFEVEPTNSDLLEVAARDAEQDKAVVALRPLRGYDCHLRILWGRITGDTYLAGMPEQEGTPAEDWALRRADMIDELDIPARRVLLGVKIGSRRGLPRDAAQTLGLASAGISTAERERWEEQVQQLLRPLRAGLWRARLASPELLAWSIAREFHSDAPIPTDDVIEGAPLARLTAGHVNIGTDHYEVVGTDGGVAAYGSVLPLTDFPEQVVTPGHEWLAVLSTLEMSPVESDADEGSWAVLAEASVRFHLPSTRTARGVVDEARQSAKEQRKSAEKAKAGEPEDAILEAEEQTRDIVRDLTRGRLSLVRNHPRIVVTATTRAALAAKVSAVRSAYDDLGILASIGVHEQGELWLETLPGDQVRVDDLGHWQTDQAFVASWFWGGSRCGSRDPQTPAVGWTTGTTADLVRWLATDAVDNGDAPVTVFTGRTRRGKTTALQLACLDVMHAPKTAHRKPWVAGVDCKGDLDGLAVAAQLTGVDARLVEVTPEDAGVCDALVNSAPAHRADNCITQLSLLLSPTQVVAHEHLLKLAVHTVLDEYDEPASWQVIEELQARAKDAPEDSPVVEVADTLAAAASRGFGRMVAGRPDANAAPRLSTDEGITILQIPDLSLPEVDEKDPAKWDATKRASVAVMRGVLNWVTAVAGAPEMRERPTVVAIPEVHVLTATSEGRTFLDRQARMGAAFGLTLLLDTQDVSGILASTGLAEGVGCVFGFAQRTAEEQDSLARLLGLPVSEHTRRLIGSLDRAAEDDRTAIRRGHALHRDLAGDVATMQWQIPGDDLAEAMSTTAEATASRWRTRHSDDQAEPQADEGVTVWDEDDEPDTELIETREADHATA